MGHARWVRLTHWVVTAAFLVLTVTGFVILMAHPRLYWGETGNDLTPALLELPISRNYQHGGWVQRTPFSQGANAPVSAVRTFEIFNKNGWGRSLHFLAGWFLVAAGAAYLAAGMLTRHFRRHLIPRSRELSAQHVKRELADHLRLRIPPSTGGPHYGLLQKLAYLGVAFVAFPLVLATGLGMSPTFASAFPMLTGAFGGVQSARTVHFALAVGLVLFVVGHVLMIVRSGFARHMRAMTLGR